jgi:hypothetical protein
MLCVDPRSYPLAIAASSWRGRGRIGLLRGFYVRHQLQLAEVTCDREVIEYHQG